MQRQTERGDVVTPRTRTEGRMRDGQSRGRDRQRWEKEGQTFISVSLPYLMGDVFGLDEPSSLCLPPPFASASFRPVPVLPLSLLVSSLSFSSSLKVYFTFEARKRKSKSG